MIVTAKTIERDGKSWMTLSAAFDESLIKSSDRAPPPPPGPAGAARARQPARKSAKEDRALNSKVGRGSTRSGYI